MFYFRVFGMVSCVAVQNFFAIHWAITEIWRFIVI